MVFRYEWERKESVYNNQKIVSKLVCNELSLHSDSFTALNGLPQYIGILFHDFFASITRIQIIWKAWNEDVNDGNENEIGYKSIIKKLLIKSDEHMFHIWEFNNVCEFRLFIVSCVVYCLFVRCLFVKRLRICFFVLSHGCQYKSCLFFVTRHEKYAYVSKVFALYCLSHI